MPQEEFQQICRQEWNFKVPQLSFGDGSISMWKPDSAAQAGVGGLNVNTYDLFRKIFSFLPCTLVAIWAARG